MVGRAGPARDPAGGARRRDGPRGRRGREAGAPRHAAGRGRGRVRRPPGPRARPPGARREPRQPGRGPPLRPAGLGVRDAAGHGAPGGPDARHGPHGRARLRPRHDRPAHEREHGLHRGRSRPDARRSRLGRGPPGLVVVASARPPPRLGDHPLVPARERGVEGAQHGGGARRAAPRRVRVPPRGGSAGREGAASLRPRGLGDGSVPRPPATPAPAPVRGHAPARAAAGLEPPGRRRREPGRARGPGPRSGPR